MVSQLDLFFFILSLKLGMIVWLRSGLWSMIRNEVLLKKKKKSNASTFSFSLANGWDMETANVLSQKLESSFEYTNQPAHPEP